MEEVKLPEQGKKVRKSRESKKQAMKEALEEHFEGLLEQINQRFDQAATQFSGLAEWSRKNLDGLYKETRRVELNFAVVDIAISSVVELLVEKGIFTREEYDKKTQELYERKESKK